MTEISATQSHSLQLAHRVDDVVSGDLLVVGSPPPEGRDLDVVARPGEHAKLAEWLASSGFSNEHDEWVRFAQCSVEAVDLLSSTGFGLDESATKELFAGARPLPGFDHLARPAPHHVLLMLARWTAEGDGSLPEKGRARIARALDEDPEAWRNAESRAAPWRATNSLAALRRAYTTGTGFTRAERSAALAEAVYAPGRTRFRARVRASLAVSRKQRKSGRLVSFSGLDGAGKSSQAEALQETLERLGFDVAVQWTRLEWTTLWENRWLGVLGWPARATLALVSRLRSRGGASAAGAGEHARPLEPSALRERSALISHVWVAIVALAHAAAQRRETRGQLRAGKIVICDRYTLDTAVHLRFRYGERRNYRFQTGLVGRLSPRPIASYLLDVPAATAHARKAEQYSLEDLERQASLYRQEWSRLGARRLDGELPRAQLCAQIATEVWQALREAANQ